MRQEFAFCYSTGRVSHNNVNRRKGGTRGYAELVLNYCWAIFLAEKCLNVFVEVQVRREERRETRWDGRDGVSMGMMGGKGNRRLKKK